MTKEYHYNGARCFNKAILASKVTLKYGYSQTLAILKLFQHLTIIVTVFNNKALMHNYCLLSNEEREKNIKKKKEILALKA